MGLEYIRLSETCLTKTNIGWYHLHLESKNLNLTKKEQTYGEQTSGYQLGKGRGKWQDRGMGLTGINYYV